MPAFRHPLSGGVLRSRIQIALAVYAFAVLGVFLLTVPWTSIWDRATLAFAPTMVGRWVRSGWFRGAVSGLGMLNCLAAIQEAGSLWRSLRESEKRERRS
jgi:hypothetical protein